MKKLLLILPLLFWLGCEDEGVDDSIAPIYGLWEWRYYYVNDSLITYEPVRWWSLLSEDNYSERVLHDIDTDSACYSDWFIVDDDSTSSGTTSSWEIFGEDSATLILFLEDIGLDDFMVIFKAVEDTLYWYNSIQGNSYPISKAVRIESHDFSPLCE